MKHLPILILLLATVAATGCGDTPAQPHPHPGPSIPPKVGSTFTYREFSIDSNGREVTGTSRTVTATVVSSDTTFAGRSGLTLFQEDTVRYYVEYTSSGDVIVRSDTRGFVGGGLQTWPFGGRTSATDVFTDSLAPTGDSIKTFVASSYYEASFTTTPAGTFNSHKMSSYILMRSFPDNTLIDSTLDIIRWYAPALGVEVKNTVDTDASSGPNYRRIKELMSYVLK